MFKNQAPGTLYAEAKNEMNSLDVMMIWSPKKHKAVRQCLNLKKNYESSGY